MNQNVIRQIAINSHRQKRGRVGQEPIQQPKPGFLQFDPEWARLKRLELLKRNWGKLYTESERTVTDNNLKTKLKQSYASFRNWSAAYRTWSDVAFDEFPEQLIKQTIIYNDFRDKVLPYLHRKKEVSQTIPGESMIRTPPRTLSSALGKTTSNIMTGLFVLGALWIVMTANQKGQK